MDSLESKLRSVEIEKAEMSAREQSIKENITQLRQDKERAEQEAEDRIASEKREA